jgi:hypothetical protein
LEVINPDYIINKYLLHFTSVIVCSLNICQITIISLWVVIFIHYSFVILAFNKTAFQCFHYCNCTFVYLVLLTIHHFIIIYCLEWDSCFFFSLHHSAISFPQMKQTNKLCKIAVLSSVSFRFTFNFDSYNMP